MKVLIVDDSRAMRSVIGRLVKKLGHETVEAGHGKEALEKLATGEHVDVALVDWNMPLMNGLELVQALRASANHANLPLLMVTSETEVERVVAAMEAGADEYLMKPFTDQELATKIELALAARANRPS
jgi:two-component system chemotaxis response regulator CheY